MAAVSTFVARRPSPRQAALFGVRWALGHGLSLLLIGSLLFALRAAVESQQPYLFASGVLERIVGLVLIGLGLWTLLLLWTGGREQKQTAATQVAATPEPAISGQTAPSDLRYSRWSLTGRKLHTHGMHTHEMHTHEMHTHDEYGRHKGENLGSLWMGMLHGLAGTGAFVGQAAIALSQSYWFVLLYTLAFGVGVMLAMGFYAGILGGTISWGGRRAQPVLHTARALTGTLACGIGVCLLMSIEIPGLFDHWVH